MPPPPFKVEGFSACRECGREKYPEDVGCRIHGGQRPTWEMLRRTIYRQIRGGVVKMAECVWCAKVPFNHVSCPACTWIRGATMGVAGLAEVMGWEDDVTWFLDLVSVPNPKGKAGKVDT